MTANELLDPRDRAAAKRAEESACIVALDYDILTKAFDFYKAFHAKPAKTLFDLEENEITAVLAIAAHAPREE